MSRERIPAVGSTVADKYVLESVVGQGGMGAVFRARHLLTDRRVALKWMLPDLEAGDAGVQRFLREARAMGRIDHPSVVGVLDVGVEGGAAFLVMELLRGTSLRGQMIEGEGMPAERAIALLMPALEGVSAAHAAGVVHRDLKPENLFVVIDEQGHPTVTKVLDFGVSKLRDDRAVPGAPGSGSITRTGAMVGTPAYMAPEQVRGHKDLDARTDVWAMGAILYEMISGALPFHAETVGGMLIAIATEAETRIETRVPALPTGLADVLHRALAKSPNERFDDIAGFARALEPYASGIRYRTPRPSSHHPPAMDVRALGPTPTPSPARGSGASRIDTMISGTAGEQGVDVHVSIAGAPIADAVPAPSPAWQSGVGSAGSAVGSPATSTAPGMTPRALAPDGDRSSIPGAARRTWGWAALAAIAVLGLVTLGVLASTRGGADVEPPRDIAGSSPELRVEPAPTPSIARVADPIAPTEAILPTEIAPTEAAPTEIGVPAEVPLVIAPPEPRPEQASGLARPRSRPRRTETPTTTAERAPVESGRGRTGTISREDF